MTSASSESGDESEEYEDGTGDLPQGPQRDDVEPQPLLVEI